MTDEDIRRAPRLCYFAHYHPAGTVADYVLHYLAALSAEGFAVVVVSTADLGEADRAKLSAACARLVMRENVGLDFGSWQAAFARFPPQEAAFLLLANDSVYAPVGDLSGFIERLTAVPADFYGAVESAELGPHLQSWFVLLRPAAYRSAAFRRLMEEPIPPDLSKMGIVHSYEWGLTERLAGEGLSWRAGYSPSHAGPIARALPFNPTHLLWCALIADLRIPFLKVELLRDNPVMAGGISRWRRVVGRRAPALVPMIEADAASRGAAAAPSFRQRLGWSVYIERAVYWPELHPLMVRDSVSRNRHVLSLNATLFRWAEWTGRRLRWLKTMYLDD